jgi:hypothetical protein
MSHPDPPTWLETHTVRRLREDEDEAEDEVEGGRRPAVLAVRPLVVGPSSVVGSSSLGMPTVCDNGGRQRGFQTAIEKSVHRRDIL